MVQSSKEKNPELQEDMMKEKLMELFRDEEFFNKLTGCESSKGALELLGEYGLEVTEEELKEIFDTLSAPEGELSEEALKHENKDICL